MYGIRKELLLNLLKVFYENLWTNSEKIYLEEFITDLKSSTFLILKNQNQCLKSDFDVQLPHYFNSSQFFIFNESAV